VQRGSPTELRVRLEGREIASGAFTIGQGYDLLYEIVTAGGTGKRLCLCLRTLELDARRLTSNLLGGQSRGHQQRGYGCQ
jgi:hypothetical protein